MIQYLIVHETLMLKYPNINYGFWKDVKEYNCDEDITNILDRLLIDADCSTLYNNQQVVKTTSFVYETYLSHYYYYLLRIRNQFIYNMYFDKLIDKHALNIKFEDTFEEIVIPNKTTMKKGSANQRSSTRGADKKPRGVKNQYVRQETTDLITGKITYLYSNAKTEDVIQSEDPNLLDELNGKKKKKATKVITPKKVVFSFTIPKKN